MQFACHCRVRDGLSVSVYTPAGTYLVAASTVPLHYDLDCVFLIDTNSELVLGKIILVPCQHDRVDTYWNESHVLANCLV